ncbi:O-antigen ligase family protein [Bacteroidota bacterium]
MRLSLGDRQETSWVYLVSFIFIAMNAILIAKEFYYLSLAPLVLLIVLMAIFSLDRLVLIAVFTTPLSIQLSDIIDRFEFNLSLPSEPIILGILLFFLLKYLFEGEFDRKILRHPVSVVIWFNLIWIFITSITSTMPLVSFKFLISRIWFIVAFYLVASQIFRNREGIHRFIWIYIFSFLIVIGYAWSRHASFGFFHQQAAHWVVQPFYNDHTSYGATLAMLIPVVIGFILVAKASLLQRVSAWVVTAILLAAVLFSYTRAAWISLIGTLGVFLVVRLRIKLVYLLILGSVFITFLYTQRTEIKINLEQNRQVSSEDLMEHVKSISNVATDASNMERLNRWSCAWRMFKEKPVFGWGPGTYMFKYAPFQLSREKTEISTNAATRGNAHSEYIGPLAESGIIGTISFLSIVIFTLITGIRNWFTIGDRRTKILSLALVLGLVTYYLHGLLNNFLDTDKGSVLFWGYTAAIVAIDVYHRNTEPVNPEETNK